MGNIYIFINLLIHIYFLTEVCASKTRRFDNYAFNEVADWKNGHIAKLSKYFLYESLNLRNKKIVKIVFSYIF